MRLLACRAFWGSCWPRRLPSGRTSRHGLACCSMCRSSRRQRRCVAARRLRWCSATGARARCRRPISLHSWMPDKRGIPATRLADAVQRQGLAGLRLERHAESHPASRRKRPPDHRAASGRTEPATLCRRRRLVERRRASCVPRSGHPSVQDTLPCCVRQRCGRRRRDRCCCSCLRKSGRLTSQRQKPAARSLRRHSLN